MPSKRREKQVKKSLTRYLLSSVSMLVAPWDATIDSVCANKLLLRKLILCTIATTSASSDWSHLNKELRLLETESRSHRFFQPIFTTITMPSSKMVLNRPIKG